MQQNDSIVEEMKAKQDIVVRDKDESSASIVCCNQLNSLTTPATLKHDYKQCVDRQKNGTISMSMSSHSLNSNNSSKINVDYLTTPIISADADDADNLLLLQKLSINNPFYRFRKQSTSLLALDTCEGHKTFKLRKARSESKFLHNTETSLNLNYKLLDNNMIITNPFSIFHDEAELELNVQTKRLVKRPLQHSRTQPMAFALNRFERQDFAQPTTQSASRKRAGQLLKKLALGKWPKASRAVGSTSHVDSQLKKLKISYPNHTQSWRRATPNEQSSYLSRLHAKTRQGLQKVREKCRTWRQTASRPQAASGVPTLLNRDASFRYINDSAHISRYEAHCKQSLLYKSYKSEFELSKNLHYLDAYLQEHFEQNLPSSTGKSQSVGRISTKQRALMRQNMFKDVDVDGMEQVKSESRALMYEANLNNYTQSDSLPSDTLSSSEYASVFSGLHARTASIDANTTLDRELLEGELQFAASLTTFPMLIEENRKLKLPMKLEMEEYGREKREQYETSTVVGNLLPKLDPNFTNLNLNVNITEIEAVREHKKKFETRARNRERERDVNVDGSLLASNQNISDVSYYRGIGISRENFKVAKRENKECVKMCENMEENIKTFEECNKIKYESYLQHFQRQQSQQQQQYVEVNIDDDDSYIYNYSNKLKKLKLKEHIKNKSKKNGSEIENFYDDTFVENGLTTENMNADKREVTKKLCYMHTGEFTEEYCEPISGDVEQLGRKPDDDGDWVVSDTLRTYDADKGSFMLSNGNVSHKIEQQQYDFYKQQQEAQQKSVTKIKRKHSERFKNVKEQRQEVTLTPFLSVGSSTRRSKSSNSSGGSRHFDDEDEHNVATVDDDNDVGNRYVVDTDSDDDNTRRNSFVNVFYSGSGYNVDANSSTITTTTTAKTATKYNKVSSTMTNSGRFNNLTDHTRFNEFYKRPLTNTCSGVNGGGGGSSLNSSTLSTTSSSSSTTSQQQHQQQLKYLQPTYSQTKHANKYLHQSQQQQQQQREKSTSTIIGNYADSRYAPLSGDYFERFLIKTSTNEIHENTRSTITTTTAAATSTAKTKENTPAFITALNYYGTGAAVDSLYAHSAYAHQQQQQQLLHQQQQQQTTINKIEGSHYKQQQILLSNNSHINAGTETTTATGSGILQKRYQLMPNNTITNNSTNASTSTSRPQGAGYILEYEC